jgi:transcriptional regulator with XRE-family HTH domain
MNRVRKFRTERGLPQYTLAVRAGISPAWLSIIERYGHIPGSDIRTRLADALGVSEEALWPMKAGEAVENQED